MLRHARYVALSSFTRPRVFSSSIINRNLQRVSLSSHCPSCSATLPTSLPACTACGYISGVPSTASFHEILGMPSEPNPFVVNLVNLKRRFLEAQTVCHPDSWITKGTSKKDTAQGLSTLVNEAYHHLSKPLPRIEYILKLNGFEISEHDQLDDMDFISEIMEAREELELAGNGGSERVFQLADRNTQKIRDALSDLEELVWKKDWKAAKAAAVRLKYLQSFENAANDLLHRCARDVAQ